MEHTTNISNSIALFVFIANLLVITSLLPLVLGRFIFFTYSSWDFMIIMAMVSGTDALFLLIAASWEWQWHFWIAIRSASWVAGKSLNVMFLFFSLVCFDDDCVFMSIWRNYIIYVILCLLSIFDKVWCGNKLFLFSLFESYCFLLIFKGNERYRLFMNSDFFPYNASI